MKSLIVFCSSHGTTEKAAVLLRNQLNGEVVMLNLNQTKTHPNLDLFDTVIIGGSIHAGTIQRKVKRFMGEYHDVLMRKRIGLFLCCMNQGDAAKEQFENVFPNDLKEKAVVKGLFGGEFLISKMNFIEKMMVKKVSGVTIESSNLNAQSILQFAERINQPNRH